MKRIVCAILCILIVAAFAGCGAKRPASAGVDLIEKLNSLMVSDKDLGIAGKYTKLSEIADGSIDADLVGTWITADGETTYTYDADGTSKATSAYGDSEAPFTCIAIGDRKIVCQEVELSPEFYDGAQPGDTQLTYTAYSVENDALYQVIVEEVNEDYTSNMSALVMLYRADESGSAAAAIAKNPIDMSALNGTWADDEKGSFTIEDGVLTLGADNYNVSFDEKNQLVVEKDGQSTAYHMAVSRMKEYDYEDRTQFTTSTMMGVSYTGADENDIPNLLSVLTDYKTEFEYDSWYYSGSFKLQDSSDVEDEDGQNPVMNFIGNYQSDRRTMLVEAQGMDEAKVTVHWGSDAWTYAEWVLTGKIEEEGDGLVMRYTDGAYATVTADENGNETRTDETADLTGTVWFNSDNTITWTDDQDEQIKDLVFEWLPVISEEEADEEVEASAPLFEKGVWSASIDGKIDTYFVFYDASNGRTERADGTGGVPFTCEQNGWDVTFHFGSADDTTYATFSEGDNTGTFDYGDGNTVVYTFELVSDADADTFEVPAN